MILYFFFFWGGGGGAVWGGWGLLRFLPVYIFDKGRVQIVKISLFFFHSFFHSIKGGIKVGAFQKPTDLGSHWWVSSNCPNIR